MIQADKELTHATNETSLLSQFNSKTFEVNDFVTFPVKRRTAYWKQERQLLLMNRIVESPQEVAAKELVGVTCGRRGDKKILPGPRSGDDKA